MKRYLNTTSVGRTQPKFAVQIIEMNQLNRNQKKNPTCHRAFSTSYRSRAHFFRAAKSIATSHGGSWQVNFMKRRSSTGADSLFDIYLQTA